MEEICSVTGLTLQERQDLASAWRKMIGTTPREFRTAGINLVLWMFDNIPNMRARFSKFPASKSREQLVADEMFLAHTQSVILALDSTIKILDNPPKLKRKLQGLVRSHVSQSPPIGSEYFVPFAKTFHVFIVATLNLPPDHPEVLAWTKFLFALCELVKAEEEAQGKGSKSRGSWGGPPCCGIL